MYAQYAPRARKKQRMVDRYLEKYAMNEQQARVWLRASFHVIHKGTGRGSALSGEARHEEVKLKI